MKQKRLLLAILIAMLVLALAACAGQPWWAGG